MNNEQEVPMNISPKPQKPIVPPKPPVSVRPVKTVPPLSPAIIKEAENKLRLEESIVRAKANLHDLSTWIAKAEIEVKKYNEDKNVVVSSQALFKPIVNLAVGLPDVYIYQWSQQPELTGWSHLNFTSYGYLPHMKAKQIKLISELSQTPVCTFIAMPEPLTQDNSEFVYRMIEDGIARIVNYCQKEDLSDKVSTYRLSFIDFYSPDFYKRLYQYCLEQPDSGELLASTQRTLVESVINRLLQNRWTAQRRNSL